MYQNSSGLASGEDIMSFISLAKRQDAKDLLTEDLNSLLKTAPVDQKEVFLILNSL